MTRSPRVELVYFEGCPHAAEARENIRSASLAAFGEPIDWAEWDLMADSTPASLKRYGSPTVLVDGRDVTGDGPGSNAALACRSDGAPTAALIAEFLGAG